MRRQLILACWSYILQILVHIVHSPIMAGCGKTFPFFLSLTLNFPTINLPILNSIFSFIPRELRPQFTSRKMMVAFTVFIAPLQRSVLGQQLILSTLGLFTGIHLWFTVLIKKKNPNR